MSYHHNTNHVASMRAAHLLIGGRDEQSVVAPTQIQRSAMDAVNHDVRVLVGEFTRGLEFTEQDGDE